MIIPPEDQLDTPPLEAVTKPVTVRQRQRQRHGRVGWLLAVGARLGQIGGKSARWLDVWGGCRREMEVLPPCLLGRLPDASVCALAAFCCRRRCRRLLPCRSSSTMRSSLSRAATSRVRSPEDGTAPHCASQSSQ